MAHQAKRATALAEQTSGLARQAALGQQAKILQTRARQLSERAREVDELLEAAARLRELGAAADYSDDKTSGIRLVANQLLASLEQDPNEFLAEKDLPGRFINPLKAYCKQWRARLLESWQGWVRSQATFQPEALLSVLENIGSRRQQVARVRDLQGRLESLSEKLPGEGGEAQVRAFVAELADAQSLIPFDDLPDRVVAFLQKLGAKQARLSDVDDSVRSWLDSENLLGEFAVVSNG